jgi:two-component system cell cycle sensor histidine kinase/response regulator CckA
MAQDPRPPTFFSARLAIVVILLVGAFGAIWGYYDARDRNRQHAEDEFARRAAILHSLTREFIGNYEKSLFGLHLAFSVRESMTHDQFVQISGRLRDRDPGVQAFEWVPVVPASQRAAMEAALGRSQGKVSLPFTESQPNGELVRAAERAEYYPIFYTEPLQGNDHVLGFDLRMGSTFAAMERARETRQMALTGQLRLLQGDVTQKGVIMIWPVYAAAPASAADTAAGSGPFLGFVQAVFRVQDMLETTRARTWKPESILDMLFVDDSEPNPARRILYYRPGAYPAATAAIPTEWEFRESIYEEYPLPIGGRNWKILYRPRAGWIESQITPLPWVRTAGILAITFLLAGLVSFLGRRSADIAREVTERTAELNESRRLLDSLLHALPGMAYRCLYDEQLKVIYVSEGAAKLTGYPPDDFIWGKVHFRQLIHPEDVGRVREATLAGLKEHRDIEVEYRLVQRDGTEKWVLSRGRGVYDEAGRLLFLEGLAIDVTASKQAEADKLAIERKLLDGQKLESLGLLAGGIAHDFNNILTGILGNANLARFKLGEDSKIVPHLRKIELATARAAELCQQMLAYAGKSSFLIEPVDLSQLVQDTLPLLHTSLASRARLHLDLSPQPAVVMADATQLRQIVMNLVLNAADAVGERLGEIHVATGVRTFDGEFLRATRDADALAPGEFAFVEVRDNGCGMAPETMARIFDPFFTTKFAGRGLGLAAVRGIVRGHHGTLHVASALGHGSTFTLLLPPSPGTVTVANPVPDKSRQYSGKALVIDDESTVRDSTAGLLATLGFTVVTADNGANGIAQFCTGPADFALVLLDLTMPGLNGEDTLASLRVIASGVRVLLISGYSENARVARLAGAAPTGFLQKPFTREALELKLRELLN